LKGGRLVAAAHLLFKKRTCRGSLHLNALQKVFRKGVRIGLQGQNRFLFKLGAGEPAGKDENASIPKEKRRVKIKKTLKPEQKSKSKDALEYNKAKGSREVRRANALTVRVRVAFGLCG